QNLAGGFSVELSVAQKTSKIVRGDVHLIGLAFGDTRRDLTRHAPEHAFHLTNPGLARIVTDDAEESHFIHGDVSSLETGFPDLPRNDVTQGNLQFFLVGVPGQTDDLHAIQKRAGNRIECIGGRDEKYLRKIKGQIEIVVSKLPVLLRIENFE